MTFARSTAGYQDLLDRLQIDGFTPLHYEFYWWIGQGMPLAPHVALHRGPILLTPRVMRTVPALFGTLMVPAIYFLAFQVFRRRPVALLASLLTACSAYMMVYSRDAKMYMDLWLFATLHIACLLWWLDSSKRIAWLAWLATGLAMGGLHASGLAILLIEPIILLTARRHRWHQTLLLLIGVAIIGAGPAGYYLGFNKFVERTDEETGSWDASGLEWIRQWQSGATPRPSSSTPPAPTSSVGNGLKTPISWNKTPLKNRSSPPPSSSPAPPRSSPSSPCWREEPFPAPLPKFESEIPDPRSAVRNPQSSPLVASPPLALRLDHPPRLRHLLHPLCRRFCLPLAMDRDGRQPLGRPLVGRSSPA